MNRNQTLQRQNLSSSTELFSTNYCDCVGDIQTDSCQRRIANVGSVAKIHQIDSTQNYKEDAKSERRPGEE